MLAAGGFRELVNFDVAFMLAGVRQFKGSLHLQRCIGPEPKCLCEPDGPFCREAYVAIVQGTERLPRDTKKCSANAFTLNPAADVPMSARHAALPTYSA